ncbi:unnamed protein product [Lactuca saligna]|uniref:Uncharacterized protein n=1 Tax=Lactuca saligna TaxID=75948 RepID=A0AA35ZIW9_LACSI|nr:unnamed protein product [Lactuca saligna]
MFRVVPTASKILEAYRKLSVLGFCPLIDKMRAVLEEADKPNKGEKKKAAKEGILTTISDTQSDVPIEVHELVQTEDIAATSNPEFSHPISINQEVTFQIPVSDPITDEFFDNILIPSPTTTISTPTSIAPCHLSPLDTGNSTPPISPLRQNGQDMIFGDDDDFARFTYSPFKIRSQSDDESPITRGQLKAINETLDSLLHATNTSSTNDYSQATIKSILDTLTNEHSSNLENMNKAVDASAILYNNMTEKLNKLINHAQVFMEKFESSIESNTTKANEAISILGLTLKTEKVKLLD